MREMAADELAEAEEEEKRLQHLLLKSLLPKDDADERDCVLEVRAGDMTLMLLGWFWICVAPAVTSCWFTNFFGIYIWNLRWMIIWAGTGGEEASLFAMDIFRM